LICRFFFGKVSANLRLLKMADDEPVHGFQGAWIPASLWVDPSLSWLEKCLIAEVDNLSIGSPCFASSEHLATMMGSTPASIRNMLSDLTRRGYLWQLGSDGRRTWRCANIKYSQNAGKYEAWLKTCNPQVTAEVTARLHRDTR
jgi:hypothetical protein